MPQVKSQVLIQAPFQTVWALAQDVERFPDIMPDLDSVEIIEETQSSPEVKRTVTQWSARIKQFNRTINWTEEDLWNSETGECYFWQLKGDFTGYKGVWKFVPRGESTLVDLEIDYAFDIPLVGALLKAVMQKLMQQNADMMADSLKKAAEAAPGGTSNGTS